MAAKTKTLRARRIIHMSLFGWLGALGLLLIINPRHLAGVEAGTGVGGNILGYTSQLLEYQQRSWIDQQLANYRDFPRLDLAFRLIQEGRPQEARSEVEKLLARNPKDVNAQSVEMAILAQLKDYNGTLQIADRLLARYSSFAPALMYRGIALQALGRNDDALADWLAITKIKKLTPGDYVFSLNAVLDLSLSAKKYDQALDAAKELSTVKPDAYLYYRQSLALQALGRAEEAEAALETAAELATEIDQKVKLLLLAGDLRYGQQRWTAAEALYQRALNLRSSDPDVWRRLSHASYQNHDYRASAQRMKQCLALRSSREDEQYLANVLIAAKNYAEADERLRIILAKTPEPKDAAMVYRQLIEVARLRRDNDAALRYVRSLLQLRAGKEEEDLLFTVLREQGNYAAMVNELENFVSDRGSHPGMRYEALIELGTIYEIQRDFNKASEIFGKAVDLNRCLQSLTLLSESLGEAGRNDEAVRFTEEVLKLQPSPETYVRSAVLYMRLGKTENALHSLEAALAANPSAALLNDIYRQQGYLYSQAKQFDKAETAFSRALEANPQDPELLKAISEICIERHEYQAALKYLEELPDSQKTTETRKMLALAYAGTGDFSQAATQYQAILASEPQSSRAAEEAELNLADLAARQERFEESAQHLLRAFRDGQNKKPELVLEAAERLSQAQKDREAIKTYQDLLNRPDINPALRGKAWEELGHLYAKFGDNASAVAAFRYALEVGANGAALHKSLGYSYYALKDWRAALKEFLLSSQEQEDPSTLIATGWCYERLGEPGLAIHFFEQTLRTRGSPEGGERASLLNELGFLYYGVDEYGSAAAAWQRSLALTFDPSVCIQVARARVADKDFSGAAQALSQLKPDSLGPHERVEYFDELAQIARQRGDIAGSTNAYLQANSLAPAPWRDYQLGLNETESGHLDASLSHFRAALAKDPTNLLYLKALAYGLEKAGKSAEARKVYEQLARLDTERAGWYKSLGYIDLKLGRTSESIRWFEEAVDANKKNNANSDDYELRSEITNLKRTLDVTVYQGVVSNSYSRLVFSADPFPATSGIEIAYRPPKIGFRNGRIFQVYTRLLWSNPNNLPIFDTRYYQLSLGVRYKPLTKQNLWVSVERLLHTGTPLYGGWMFRGLYSLTPGYELKPGRPHWNYSYLYSDSVYLPQSALFSQYGELRRGVSFNVHDKLLITPFAVADARWQNKNLFYGTYAEAGAGVSFRFLYNSSLYEVNRSSFELVAACKRGSVFSGTHLPYFVCSAIGIVHF